MNPLAILLPSRSRPHNIGNILDDLTTTNTQATLFLGVDADDPKLPDYVELKNHVNWRDSELVICPPSRLGIVDAINTLYQHTADNYQHFAFIGDDVRIRTKWEQPTLDLLNTIGAGVVYWNDLHYGRELCTHWAVTGNIPATIGAFLPDAFQHLYSDNYYFAIGQALGSLYYLPDVVVEHCHGYYDKAPIDEQYVALNTREMFAHDKAAFDSEINTPQFAALITALKPLVTPLEGKDK